MEKKSETRAVIFCVAVSYTKCTISRLLVRGLMKDTLTMVSIVCLGKISGLAVPCVKVLLDLAEL